MLLSCKFVKFSERSVNDSLVLSKDGKWESTFVLSRLSFNGLMTFIPNEVNKSFCFVVVFVNETLLTIVLLVLLVLLALFVLLS